MKNINYLILIFLILISCKNTIQYNDPIPKHNTFKIESKKVGETRIINVWTPPTYNNSNKSFPVLYMPDGGIKENFPHIANTLAKLIKQKDIQPVILVGIENTVRGRDLTGYSVIKEDEQYCPLTDGAKNFRAFITQELMPVINSKYRTSNEKGIIGESLAGLFVMETFLQYPETFDFYIAIDPSIWWNDHYLVKNAAKLLRKFPDKKLKLWFAGSSLEKHKYSIAQYTNQLAKILKTNTPNKLHWKYSYEPKEKHNTIFRATKVKALKWTLNK